MRRGDRLQIGKTVLELDESDFLLAVNLAAVVEFFTIPVYGILSDYWSRKAVYSCGCLFLIAFALPYYALLHTREPTPWTRGGG